MRFAFCGRLAREGGGGLFLGARSAGRISGVNCAHFDAGKPWYVAYLSPSGGPDCALGSQSFITAPSSNDDTPTLGSLQGSVDPPTTSHHLLGNTVIYVRFLFPLLHSKPLQVGGRCLLFSPTVHPWYLTHSRNSIHL